MTAEELKSWRERHRLSMQKASEALGCAKNSILNWERGQTIPLYIALACAAYSFGHKPMGEQEKPE